jgi:hypothetical protein
MGRYVYRAVLIVSPVQAQILVVAHASLTEPTNPIF